MSMTERNKVLDSLKGLAILGVVAIHSGGANLAGIAGRIGSTGGNGVQLFFIVSAYLLFLSISKIPIENGKYKKELGMWYIRRFWRLIPLYWIYLMVYSIINRGSITWKNIFFNALFIHGISPNLIDVFPVVWYVADLAILIVITPILYLIIKKTRKLFVFTIWSTIFMSELCKHMILASYGTSNEYANLVFWNTTSFFSEFPIMLLGVGIWYIESKQLLKTYAGNKLLGYTILGGCLYVLYNVTVDHVETLGFTNNIAVGICFFILIISQMIYPVKFLANNIVLESIGKNSYGIYLFHILIIQAWNSISLPVESYTISFFIKFMVVMALSYLISIIGASLIEKPLKKLMGSIFY